MNKLIYRGKEYDDLRAGTDTLVSVSAFVGDCLPAASLSADTLTAEVIDAGTASGATLDKQGEYGEPVLYYHNDSLIGRFYLERIVRTGKRQYKLSCVSAIGLLLASYHYGGIYTGERMDAVLSDIVGGIIPYTVDEELGAVPMYGCLRKGTRRDNLRDLLFAVGGQVRKDTQGTLQIVPMRSGVPYAITADEFYLGGSVTGGNPASEVRVTEHGFLALPEDEEQTLYEAEAAAEELVTPKGAAVTGVLVDFSEPMHDLTVEHAEILESGPNYAVLSASSRAILTGRRYTHTKRVISRKRDTGGVTNVVTSDGCELVSALNAELVADRLMAYYGSAKTVEADIVASGQKPGDAVSFPDPFGEETVGYIGEMELTMSAILKAHVTLISGYLPTASGNYYTDVCVIAQDGVFRVPEKSNGKLRVVLIGGGDGGESGGSGGDGKAGSGSSYGSGGTGGESGARGGGGKIAVYTIPVTAGEEYEVRLGKGGAGAVFGGTAQAGSPTTFGALSSAEGYPSESGYQDLISGTVYATPGAAGLAGGSGSTDSAAGESVSYLGTTYTPGAKGSDAVSGTYYGRGGCGGGAAAGRSGGAGGSGKVEANSGNPYATGGAGGRGATPVKAQNGAVPGQGGQGGHGGGGGGGGGPANGSGSSYTWYGQGGAGGTGGEGGDGADGIVLVFYGTGRGAAIDAVFDLSQFGPWPIGRFGYLETSESISAKGLFSVERVAWINQITAVVTGTGLSALGVACGPGWTVSQSGESEVRIVYDSTRFLTLDGVTAALDALVFSAVGDVDAQVVLIAACKGVAELEPTPAALLLFRSGATWYSVEAWFATWQSIEENESTWDDMQARGLDGLFPGEVEFPE